MSTQSNTLRDWISEQTQNSQATYLFSDKVRAASQKMLDAGKFPTRKDEEWRYTPIAKLLEKKYLSGPDSTELEVKVQQAKAAAPAARHLVLVDGILKPEFSDQLSDIPGLKVIELGPETPDELQAATEMMERAQWSDDNIFKHLSIALGTSGLSISSERNSETATSLHLIHISTGETQSSISRPLIFIRVAENSRLNIIEQFISLTQSSVVNFPLTHVHVAEGGKLQHYKLGLESSATEHIGNTHVQVSGSASASLHQYLLGAGMTRTNTEVQFSGPGAELVLRGIYLGESDQHLDIRTYVDHAFPHCNSDQHYRGILNDHSRGVFNGLVLVRPDAQHTDAQQSNKNLLLSDTARVDAKPQLEIFADDVKCAHGATVGQLDPDALFYLQSRAISKEDAKLLLTRAFTAEVTADIEIQSLRESLEETISQRLNKLHSDHD